MTKVGVGASAGNIALAQVPQRQGPGLFDRAPVSYTHLDVYKRQAYWSLGWVALALLFNAGLWLSLIHI